MVFKPHFNLPVLALILAASLAGCAGFQTPAKTSPAPTITPPSPTVPSPTIIRPASSAPPTPTPDLSTYTFPASIDPTGQYLFYLHGKIIEDQGLPAISPEYGEYEYIPILEKLASYGFVVISEQRAQNTAAIEYAKRVSRQVGSLLQAGVPANNITIVGASKGAWIAVHIAHILANMDINYGLLAICHPDVIADFKNNQDPR